MALQSKTFSVQSTQPYGTGAFTFQLDLTENSTSTANNTSNVTYTLKLINNGLSRFSNYGIAWSVTLNGTVVASHSHIYGEYTSAYNSTLTFVTGTVDITHDADGDLTMSVAAAMDIEQGTYTPNDMSISDTMTLTTIPRASTMSFTTSQTMGSTYTFTITTASSSFTHAIAWSFGGTSGTAVSSIAAGTTSVTYSPPIATFAPLCTSATSGTMTYTLNTYSGGTLVGSKSYTATLYVPSSVLPSVTIASSPVNGFNSLYLQGKSSVAIAANGSVASDYSATIKSYTFTVANANNTVVATNTTAANVTTITYTTGILSGSGTHTLTVTITDSRGRSVSAVKYITVTAYSAPVFGTTTAFRCDSGGTSATEGTYVSLTANCTYSAVSGNSLTMTYATKLTTDASYGADASLSNGVTTILSGFAITNAYNIKITATDTVGSSVSIVLTISTSECAFHYDKSKHSWGFGMYVPSTGDNDSVYMQDGYKMGDDGSTMYQLAAGNYFRRIELSAGESATIPLGGNYGAVLLAGLAQGIGSLLLGITVNNGSIASVRNLMTAADFSNSYLTFSFASYALTITNGYSSGTDRFTLLIGAVGQV